jgi:hypothetical protein
MAAASFMGQYGSYSNLQLAMDKLANLAIFLRQVNQQSFLLDFLS